MSRFLIVCAARTGSTMLRFILNSHPQINCHGEVMVGNGRITGLCGFDGKVRTNLVDYFLAWRDRDRLGFLKDFVLHEGVSQPCVGAKIKYSELEMDSFTEIRRWITEEKDLKIIHLYRRNKLRRYVSNLVAQKSGVTLVMANGTLPEPTRVTVDPEECLRDLEQTEQQEQHHRELLRREGYLEVFYEDLVSDYEAQTRRIQDFLDVSPVSIEPLTRKIGQEDLSLTVENWAELRNRLEKTPYQEDLNT